MATELTDEDLAIFNRLHIRFDVLQAMRAANSGDYRAMQLRMPGTGGCNELPAELVCLETAEGITFREWCDGNQS